MRWAIQTPGCTTSSICYPMEIDHEAEIFTGWRASPGGATPSRDARLALSGLWWQARGNHYAAACDAMAAGQRDAQRQNDDTATTRITAAAGPHLDQSDRHGGGERNMAAIDQRRHVSEFWIYSLILINFLKDQRLARILAGSICWINVPARLSNHRTRRLIPVIPQGGADEKAGKFRLSSGRTNWIFQGMQSWEHGCCLWYGTHKEWGNYVRRGRLWADKVLPGVIYPSY